MSNNKKPLNFWECLGMGESISWNFWELLGIAKTPMRIYGEFLAILNNRPLALRRHVTNGSFKQ